MYSGPPGKEARVSTSTLADAQNLPWLVNLCRDLERCREGVLQGVGERDARYRVDQDQEGVGGHWGWCTPKPDP